MRCWKPGCADGECRSMARLRNFLKRPG